MEWRYCVVCYGLQFIPAFVFFFIKTKSRGRVYDEALFWCWISRPWSVLRLTLYFGPVWFSIIVGSLIHIAAGIKIYIYERGVRSATASNKLVFAAPSHEASAEEQGSENQQPNESQSSTGLEDLSVGGQSVSQSQASPQDAFTPELQTVPCNQVTRAEASGSVSASSAQSQSKYENEALSHDSLVAAGQTVSGVLLESTVNQHPVAQLLSVDWDPRLGHGPGSLLELVDSRQPSSNTRNSADLENGMNIAPEEKPSQARRQSIQRQNAARSHAQFASIYFISLLITWSKYTLDALDRKSNIHVRAPAERFIWTGACGSH
ncbi:hypothetical protein PRK78_002083 [Emydomyces testavorans]|uniref:G-protein coupled receptors family 2 profile 2 domain-containing protein n=1 Tax=Emydomyces testavorans TaxID=2070801 RepID=A0AAF0IG47_9EURO|nr:hypothetical protein PRK78_002083 [Emydomyces testavorans]